MAKRAAESKSPPQAEDKFVELMLVAADFVKNCGGLAAAKKALADAGQFIQQAGGVANAGLVEAAASGVLSLLGLPSAEHAATQTASQTSFKQFIGCDRSTTHLDGLCDGG